MNRVRIRDGGGLELLLGFLDDAAYRALFNRIISALVCFLYDEVGMEILRTSGLVTIMLKQLRRIARLDDTESTDEATKVTFTIGGEEDDEEEEIKEEKLQTDSECDLLAVTKEMDLDEGERRNAETHPEKPLDAEKSLESADLVDTAQQTSNIASESISRSNSEEAKNAQSQSKPEEPRYSIDSPTYKAISEYTLNFDTEDGPLNIIDAHQLSSDNVYSPSSSPRSRSNSPVGSFSPLSVSSYISSDWSPGNSPLPSPPMFSDDDFRAPSPMPPPASPPLPTLGSDDPEVTMRSAASFSTLWWCPKESSQDTEFSESNEQHKDKGLGKARDARQESAKEDTKKSDISSEDVLVSDPLYLDTMASTDFGRALQGNSIAVTPTLTPSTSADSIREVQKRTSKGKGPGKRKRSQTADEKARIERRLSSSSLASASGLDLNDLMDKLKSTKSLKSSGKLDGIDIDKYKDPRKATEHNILIIIAKLSFADDPSADIVRKDVIETLLDYIINAAEPLPRASRILLRVTTNPRCFHKMLLVRLPCILEQRLGKYTIRDGEESARKRRKQETPAHGKLRINLPLFWRWEKKSLHNSFINKCSYINA